MLWFVQPGMLVIVKVFSPNINLQNIDNILTNNEHMVEL